MKNKISNNNWDGVEVVELHSGEYIARIIPDLGGNIIKLSYLGEDILNTPKSIKSYKNAQNNYGIPHLFPPNRIKGGKFSYNGKEHQFPVKPSGNSLHGFLHFSRWEIKERKEEKDFVSLTLSYVSKKESDYFSYFPYEFKCTREYILSAQGLTENYSVENLGNNPMPISVGNHTAFPLKNENKVKIKVDIEKRVILDETKIPTGEVADLDSWERSVREEGADPNYTNLDNLYTVNHNNKSNKDNSHGAVIENSHSRGDIIYRVDEKYKYWVLCNYGSRGDIICIEPQTSSIDAHNRIDGNLITLEAKNSWNTTNKLYIKDKKEN